MVESGASTLTVSVSMSQRLSAGLIWFFLAALPWTPGAAEAGGGGGGDEPPALFQGRWNLQGPCFAELVPYSAFPSVRVISAIRRFAQT